MVFKKHSVEYQELLDRVKTIETMLDSETITKLLDDVVKYKSKVDAKLDEALSLSTSSQRILQAQLTRSATLTEVLRFINIEAPEALYDSTITLMEWHDKPDSWWLAKTYLRVWQWAALLCPQKRHVWERKFGKNLDNEESEDRLLGRESKAKYFNKELA